MIQQNGIKISTQNYERKRENKIKDRLENLRNNLPYYIVKDSKLKILNDAIFYMMFLEESWKLLNDENSKLKFEYSKSLSENSLQDIPCFRIMAPL